MDERARQASPVPGVLNGWGVELCAACGAAGDP